MTTTTPAIATSVRRARGRPARRADHAGRPGYDEARAVYNAMIDSRPAAIARCRDVADVVACVRFAREHGLDLAVRGGGHNAGGLGVWDDALVIDLSPMRSTTVDPAARHRARRRRLHLGRRRPRHRRVRAGHPVRVPRHHRRRRADPRRRDRLPDPPVRADRRQPAVRRRRPRRRLASSPPARPRTPTCSGRCAAAAATSASSPRSRSAATTIGENGTIIGGPVLYDLADTAEVLRWYRELLPTLPEELSGWFGADHHPAGAAVPRGAVGPQGVRRSSGATPARTTGPTRCSRRCGRSARRCWSACSRCRSPRCRARSTRSTRPGCSGTGARTSSPRSPTRRSRCTASSARSCRPATRRCTCTRSTAPQPGAGRRDRVRLPRRRLGRRHRRGRPGPGQRRGRSRSGPATTGRSCTRRRPAARTSTS